ncbi:hypothetical protein ACJX0J_027121, partial [Zea mays]
LFINESEGKEAGTSSLLKDRLLATIKLDQWKRAWTIARIAGLHCTLVGVGVLLGMQEIQLLEKDRIQTVLGKKKNKGKVFNFMKIIAKTCLIYIFHVLAPILVEKDEEHGFTKDVKKPHTSWFLKKKKKDTIPKKHNDAGMISFLSHYINFKIR